MRDDVRLIFIDGDSNKNKFYNMHDNGNGTFTAHYGRVGADGVEKIYDISKWDSTYNAKVKKGYKDHSDDTKVLSDYKPENDPVINDLLTHFLDISRQYTSKYTNTNTLNDTAINKVQDCINELANIKSIKCGSENYKIWLTNTNQQDSYNAKETFNRKVLKDFNGVLTKIFEIIPRTMKKVEHGFLQADCSSDNVNTLIDKIITREQSLLDNIALQSKSAPTGNQSISEAFKFNCAKASQEEIDFITEKFNKDCQGESIGLRVVNVFKIGNPQRDADFEEYLQNNGLGNNNKSNKNIKLYWHGTGPENLLSILANGLMIRPSNVSYAGSAFGDGIYNAPSPMKANSYTRRDSGRNSYYMLVNAVITGNTFDCEDNYDRIGNVRICDLDGNTFSQLNLNYHSVHAHASKRSYIRRDEVIVYNSSQVASKYLIELK